MASSRRGVGIGLRDRVDRFALVNDYLSYLADRNYSPRTIRTYGFSLLAFCRWLSDEDIARVSDLIPNVPNCRTRESHPDQIGFGGSALVNGQPDKGFAFNLSRTMFDELAALAAKETAETAYLTVRVQYLLGRVDEATMLRARELYVSWKLAQEALLSVIAAAETGTPSAAGEIAMLRRRVEVLSAELARMAAEVKTGAPQRAG